MENKDRKVSCRFCGHYGEPHIVRDLTKLKKQRIEYYCTRCGNQLLDRYMSKRKGGAYER